MISLCNSICMKPSLPDARRHGGPPTAFLLAQVGAHAAAKFAERLAVLELSPPHAGILRMLNATPGVTQQALAAALRMQPSRLVAVMDELEAKELVERRANPEDRRSHALHLTPKGGAMLESVGRIGQQHQQALLTSLSDGEQHQLAGLLQRIAEEQGLVPGVHPGYSRMRRAEEGPCDAVAKPDVKEG